LTTGLGYFAALLSTASFAPQAWKIIRSRQTRDISLGMYVLTVFGFAAWSASCAANGRWSRATASALPWPALSW
jgi:MtN3 and saliva related transmembrane protein